MTDFYSQNRCVCSTRSHGPLLCAFCLSFHFKFFNSNMGPRKRQKSALARLLACFHPATKILFIAANPYIAANEM